MDAVALVGALLLVAANGFFVATEFALARIRVTQVRELERDGAPGARSLAHAVEHLDAYLAACQLGITLASIGLGVLAKPGFEHLFEHVFGPLGDASYAISFAFAFGLVTLLHVVLGELAPKSLAIARNTRTALLVAPPMRLFYLATKPFVDVFNGLGNLVLRPFGVPRASEAGHAPHSEAELREIMRHSLGEGLIEQSDVDFTEGVFVFGDREVRELMVPRPDVDALPLDMPVEQCLAHVLSSPYTRYPVYRETLDDIVGILHVRDLFAALHDVGLASVRLEAIARPAYVVPETKDLAALLADFRREKQHLAVVVDEYGAMEGIVTLEDVLEEIVGEIEDEFDLPDTSVERIDDSHIRIDGTYTIDDFNEEFGTELEREDFHTMAGLVFGALGRAPEVGDEVSVNGLKLRVLEVEGSRILRIEVEFAEKAPADEPEAA